MSLRRMLLAVVPMLALSLPGCPEDVLDQYVFRCATDDDCIGGFQCVWPAGATQGQCRTEPLPVGTSGDASGSNDTPVAGDEGPDPDPDTHEGDGLVTPDTPGTPDTPDAEPPAPGKMVVTIERMAGCYFDADAGSVSATGGTLTVHSASGDTDLAVSGDTTQAVIDPAPGGDVDLSLSMVSGSGQVVLKGRTNGASGGTSTVVLTAVGRYNCPAGADGLVATLFPTATSVPDGRVLVAGGFVYGELDGQTLSATATGQTAVFDPAVGTVTAGPVMDEVRGGHAAVWLQAGGAGHVFLHGGAGYVGIDLSTPAAPPGLAPGLQGSTYPEVWDPATGALSYADSWAWSARLRPAMAVTPGGKVLVCGGHPAQASTDCDLWDSASNPKGPDGSVALQHARTLPAAALVVALDSERVLIYGGDVGAPAGEVFVPKDDSGAFDIVAPTGAAEWVDQASLTRLTKDHYLAVGQVRSTGGGSDWSLGGARRLTLASGGGGGYTLEHTTPKSAPSARVWHATQLLADGRVLIVGGLTGFGEYTGLGDVLVYDPGTEAFTSALAPGAAGIAITGPALALLPSGAVLIAGGQAGVTLVAAKPVPAVMVFTP